MNMRLLGAPTLRNVVPEMVDISNLRSHTVSVPDDRLYAGNCECLFLYLTFNIMTLF